MSVQSFHTLLQDLGTITRNHIRFVDSPTETTKMLTTLTPLQQRAFVLLQVPCTLEAAVDHRIYVSLYNTDTSINFALQFRAKNEFKYSNKTLMKNRLIVLLNQTFKQILMISMISYQIERSL